jgi:hypothetical protein
VTAAGRAGTLRLVRVPRPAPVPARSRRPPVQGTLALDLVPAAPPAPAPDGSAWLDDDERPAACDPAGLPDPRRWTAMIAQAVVEIVAGRRPATQVVRWVEPTIYDRVRRSAGTAAGRGTSRGNGVRVRRVRVSTTPEGAVESVAVVDDGVRCRALALRLEALDGRWLCTALDVV